MSLKPEASVAFFFLEILITESKEGACVGVCESVFVCLYILVILM